METLRYSCETLMPRDEYEINDLVFTYGLPIGEENDLHGVIIGRLSPQGLYPVHVISKEGKSMTMKVHPKNLLRKSTSRR